MNQKKLFSIILNRSTYSGLTSEEAQKQLAESGPNARLSKKEKTWFTRLWKIVSEPLMGLLFATTILYFFIGSILETIILGLSLIPVIAIQFIEEQKTDRAIAALDTLLLEECKVYRDQKLQKIDLRNLVPHDLVYLTAGDKIPADGYVLRSPGLLVDESILTGESNPVVKEVIPNNIDKIGTVHTLYQGTLLVQGEADFLVTATGQKTSYGKLSNLIENIESTVTPLQKKIQKLVKILAGSAVVIALLLGSILTYRDGLTRGILGALTLAIAIIPEEFPIVFSVFLILGVWRMSKHKALVRHMPMVEILGSATVICTDKTGTLTEGMMALKSVWFEGKLVEVTKSSSEEKKSNIKILQPLFEDAVLALERVAIDPIEVETQRFAETIGIQVKQLFKHHILIKDSSFDASTKTVSHIWQDSKGIYTQYTAGAPEAVLARCQVSWEEKTSILKTYETMAGEGYRSVAIARQECDDKECFVEEGMKFSGLLFMSDPPRQEVAEAIELCQKAGIRVIMITGDHQVTAQAIGKSIGLVGHEKALSGDELEQISPKDLSQIVQEYTIFARVKPEQKYMLVQALQEQGEIVAMTGDGVNDAPALKKANIGIAMGQKGTEVARAAAGIILLDDNFATIVKAIHEGRRIYDNIRQAFVFLFSFHIPIVVMSFLPLLFGQDLFFLPIHIIFLELFCDPAAVIGFERDPARKGIMMSPPTPVTEPLINPALWSRVIIQACIIGGTSFGLYAYFGMVMSNVALGRTLAFMALVMTQLFLILFTREWEQVKKNTVLLWIIGGTMGVLHLILFTSIGRELFHFVVPSGELYGLVVGGTLILTGLVSVILKKMVK
jgi:Ca2+-transporting ATPase